MQLNILNTGVVEHDLMAHEDAPTHVDPFFVELVAHGVVAEIEQKHGHRKREHGCQSFEDIPGQELFARPFEASDFRRDGRAEHDAESLSGVARNDNVSLVLCSGQEVPLDSIAIDLAPASKLA